MKENSDDLTIIQKSIIAAGTIVVGMAINEILTFGWRKVFNEEPPEEKEGEEVDWTKIWIWTTVSGFLIGAAKTAARRSLGEALTGKKIL